MSQNIGSLAVSLSLDASNFNGSMAQVDRNLRAMGSELRAVRARGAEYGNSLEGLSSRQDVLRRSVDAANIKLTEARRKYDEMVASGTANEAQLERQARRVNEAQAQYNQLETELNEVEQALRRQSSSWHQLSERLAPIGSRLTSIGQGMANIGKNLSMKVTAPILGLGTVAVKLGMDFEESMDKVAAVSGATGEEFNKLEEMAKDLGATTKYSASEAASGMQFLAMAGFKTNDILAAMPGMLDLAAAGALDLGSAADITSNIMSAFGIEASKSSHIADVLAKAAASANTDVSQLGEAMKYLAPSANALGWSVEQSTAAIMALGDAGIQGSMAGQAFASSLGRLASPTKKMSKTMEELGLEFFDTTGKMKPMHEVIKELEIATKDMTEEQKVALLTTTFGAEAFKHWAVLLEKGSEALGENTEELISTDGAASKMAKTMSDNTKGGIKEFLSALEGLAIQLSEILLPIVNDLVRKITDWTRKFASLSPETQKTALAIAGVAAAIGPLLVVGGTLVSSLGAIVTAFSTISGALAVVTTGVTATTPAVGALASVFTALSGPIGWTIAGLAALTVGGVIAYKKATEDAIPKADLFGESVSAGTKKAVSGFLELNEKAKLALNDLSWSGKTVSKEAADSISNNFSQMAEQIRQGMEKKNTESLALMESFLVDSKLLSDREKQEVIENMNSKYSQQQEAITNGENRIKGILEKASQEKRSLTKEEQIQINNIQESMVKNGISALSKNEIEAKSIMERIKAQAGDISAQQAAEVVKNSKKQKDGAVKEAEEQYDKTVQEIIRQRDELGTISASQAERLILEAKKQKDETVKQAEEMHLKVVGEAQKQANEHVNKVNWETGEILSKWEVFKQDFSRKWDEIKSASSKKLGELSKDSLRKWEEIKAWPGKKIDEMRTAVNDKMEEVRRNIETIWTKSERYLADIDLIQIGKDIINGLIKGIGSMASAVGEKIESIANSVTTTIRKVLDIQSPSKVTTKLGKDTGQGFVNGISSTSKAAQQAAKNTADQVKKAFNFSMDKAKYEFKMGKMNSSEYISELRKIRDDYAKTADQVRKVNLEIKRIEDQRAKDLKIIREKEFKDALKTIKDKAAAAMLATDQELKMLQELASNHKKNSKERLEVEKEIKKVKDKLLKEEESRLKKQFDKEKDYLERKKSMNKMSLTQELEYLEKKKEAYQKNSDQRKWYEGEVHRVKKEINDKLISINDEYVSKVQETNQKLIAGEKQLNEEYQKALDDRAKTLYSFAGIFDELKEKSDVSGQQLIENLRGQVQVFQEWQSNISSLATRGISEGLLKELSDMGPKAYAEIAALNSLTDEQLSEYSALWEQKNVLAKEQAIKELENMKIDTQKKIEELKIQTAAELDKYKKEWETKIKQISSGTKKQFNAMAASMPQIGKNAVEGLMSGMKQMEGPLMAQAKAIADSIKSTIQSALDIHSPSRIMRGFGVNIGEGLIQGMNDTVAKVAVVAEGLANAATTSMERGTESKTTIDKSKHFNPQIIIHTQESGDKAMDRTLRRLSFEF